MGGHRRKCPVVILSRERPDTVRAMIVVAPANTNIDGLAVEVTVGALEGLSFDGVLRVALPRRGRINCHWVVTLPTANLLERAACFRPRRSVNSRTCCVLGNSNSGRQWRIGVCSSPLFVEPYGLRVRTRRCFRRADRIYLSNGPVR